MYVTHMTFAYKNKRKLQIKENNLESHPSTLHHIVSPRRQGNILVATEGNEKIWLGVTQKKRKEL